jgi:hypothetical protein
MAAPADSVIPPALPSANRSLPPQSLIPSPWFRPKVTGSPLPLRYSRWELRGQSPQPSRQCLERRFATELKDRSARLPNCAEQHCFGRVPRSYWQGGRSVRQFRKTIAQVTQTASILAVRWLTIRLLILTAREVVP